MEIYRTTSLKAIRLKCLDCCCGSAHEVKMCPLKNCPLHLFRLGKNPNRAGIGDKSHFEPGKPHTTHDSATNTHSEGIYIPEE